jgi:hypothetical protein
MLQTAIDLLDPVIKEKAQKAIAAMRADEKLKALGVDGIGISETLRHLSTQMAYYSRGRMPVQDVKAMYDAAGLWNISDADAAKPITWTLDSKHLLGRAIDLVPLRHGSMWWGAPAQVWSRMGEIGEAQGLAWGGRWKNKDSPHFEASA